MNPVVVALTSGALILAGKWSQDKAPNIDNAVGVAGIAVGLALLDQVSPKLSSAFGTLILVSIAVVYIQPIANAVKGR